MARRSIFQVGAWVVVPGYGVGRVIGASDTAPAGPAVPAYVIVIDSPSLTLGAQKGRIRKIESHQTGEQLIIPLASKVASTIRPAIGREEALRLRAVLDAPFLGTSIEPPVPGPDGPYRWLRRALSAEIEDAIEHLRWLRANPSAVVGVLARNAFDALEEVISGELAIALGEPSKRVRLLAEQVRQADSWALEPIDGRPAVRFEVKGRTRITMLDEEEAIALGRLL